MLRAHLFLCEQRSWAVRELCPACGTPCLQRFHQEGKAGRCTRRKARSFSPGFFVLPSGASRLVSTRVSGAVAGGNIRRAPTSLGARASCRLCPGSNKLPVAANSCTEEDPRGAAGAAFLPAPLPGGIRTGAAERRASMPGVCARSIASEPPRCLIREQHRWLELTQSQGR